MKLTIEDKSAHVVDWRKSGLTQRQYSELHQINIHTFKSWVQLLKKTLAESASVPSPELAAVENSVTISPSKMLSDIIPVTVAPQVSVDGVCLDNSTHHSPQSRPQVKQPNS
ncbi:IS66 family insertion sequence element accessory protein TnpA [Thorsellia anophelis]|uniref:Transposase n=1 Tax=Thorsellia anophelis DSM 18579 TaxID=1123402 RepID=A0A1I0BNT9_9GAMM|nr:hypothetical protein [Thorsellia anophelis]SET08657.1 hypothetical protein SAMN02583745_01343 [Thorsellia anophelis DSM 18579]